MEAEVSCGTISDFLDALHDGHSNLYLHVYLMNDDERARLTYALSLTNCPLKRVDFDSQDADGVACFAGNTSIEEFCLNTPFSYAPLASISTLKTLTLKECRFKSGEVKGMVDVISKLVSLTMKKCTFDAGTLAIIMRAVKANRLLQTLAFDNCRYPPRPEPYEQIIADEVAEHPSLSKLVVTFCVRSMDIPLAAMSCPNLEWLDISDNYLNDVNLEHTASLAVAVFREMEALADWRPLGSWRNTELTWRARTLTSMPTIKTINLTRQFSPFNLSDRVALMTLLQSPMIESITIAGMDMKDEYANDLASVIRGHPSLKSLVLTSTPLNSTGVKVIAAAVPDADEMHTILIGRHIGVEPWRITLAGVNEDAALRQWMKLGTDERPPSEEALMWPTVKVAVLEKWTAVWTAEKAEESVKRARLARFLT